MTIKALVFNPFYENTYIISDEDNQAIIVDPGCYEPYEQEQLKQYIADSNILHKHWITLGQVVHLTLWWCFYHVHSSSWSYKYYQKSDL